MLRLVRVTKTYPDGPATITALDAVDLEVGDGSFVAVMGPSGSGKTTLALIAAGVETPSSGEVWIDELDVAHARKAKRAVLRRQHVGVVFQSGELDPLLSAVENVALPLRLDGWSAARAGAAAREALSRCAVEGLASRFPGELSGGQRQRVAVARAVVGECRLVVADEPTASVDTATARAIVELLASLAADGVGVLMTTHDSRLAGFADEIVVLRDGARVQAAGPTVGDGRHDTWEESNS
jgi:putative ABC transport system ATP-binding protein